jgi:RimJ/RimL family protein N-acetyltransferase
MIELIDVYTDSDAPVHLYDLLRERKPEANISHKEMPTFEEHISFVMSRPYAHWYLILFHGDVGGTIEADDYAGAIYITDQREVGIAIFKCYQGRGYGSEAVEELMKLHPGTFYANIAPGNKGSIKFFEQFGAKHIQNTYVISS